MKRLFHQVEAGLVLKSEATEQEVAEEIFKSNPNLSREEIDEITHTITGGRFFPDNMYSMMLQYNSFMRGGLGAVFLDLLFGIQGGMKLSIFKEVSRG